MEDEHLTNYENDTDFKAITAAEITNERLLDFFFKKGGKVNIKSFGMLMRKKQQETWFSGGDSWIYRLHDLTADGLIKQSDSHYYEVTRKARWQRIYNNPAWIFLTFIVSVAILLLTIVLLLR